MNLKQLFFLLLLAFGLSPSGQGGEPMAKITSVRILRTNIVVEVQASGSFSRVTLESTDRVGRRTWMPRAAEIWAESGEDLRTLNFTLPISAQHQILRIKAETRSALPATFYQGTNNFVAGTGQPVSVGPGTSPTDGPTGSPAENRDSGNSRTVVESDIWKLSGDTLYFFNQYSGLQVIDVANPDAPSIRGSYSLSASGEQMYLVGSDKLVLLARDDCSWTGSSGSRLVLLQVIDGKPELVKEIPFEGWIQESRMVGDALYVVGNSYQRKVVPSESGSSEQWEWGTHVASYDLSDFANAAKKSTAWVPGWSNTIYATQEFLFVARSSWEGSWPYRSKVHVLNISSPDGVFAQTAVIEVEGTIRDKFKMHQDGSHFFAVVQVEDGTRKTVLQSFSLEDPAAPRQIGRLLIVENEQLHATRFHGKLLYAVTFFIIDPLWIVDLADPAAPRKVGELEIPGWSTYLHPLPNNKLLAIGREISDGNSQTTVQLFDVADPASPTLASKVFIGDQWSSSEANWDEKAFGILPEHTLALVPFQGSVNGEFVQAVQILDLLPDRLVKRGLIRQAFAPRRATLHQERILSLSARELLSVDARDRDNPQVTSTLPLSWAADALHLSGDYLLQVDAWHPGGPILRVVHPSALDTLLSVSSLTNLPYLGSTVNAGRLYVLQGRPRQLIYPEVYNPTNWAPIHTNPAVVLCSMFDLGNLPHLQLLGSDRKESLTLQFHGQFSALQAKADLLVFAPENRGPFPWWWAVADGGAPGLARPAVASDASFGRGMMPFWYGGDATFIPVSTGGEMPNIGKIVQLQPEKENHWGSFGGAFANAGLIFTSHLGSEFDPTYDPPPFTRISYDESGRETILTNDPPPGAWVQRHYLDVIDFNDPEDPLVRPPVNIPGNVVGLHHNGELLYTRGDNLEPESLIIKNTLAAVAYDGVTARLVDQIPLSGNWPRPLISQNGYVFLGVPPGDVDTNATLQAWTLGPEGKWISPWKMNLEEPVQEFALYGELLLAQSGKLLLFDAAEPTNLRPFGPVAFNTCYGVSLRKGDADRTRGIWLPLGWKGIVHIPLPADED